MNHFEFEEWVDYVRGDLFPNRAAELGSHLAAGCEACREQRNLADDLIGMSSLGDDEPPRLPEQVLWAARAILSASDGSGTSVLPRLKIDAIEEVPLGPVEGVRSTASADSWQGVVYAGELAVDLKMDLDPATESVSVVGQVAVRHDPDHNLENLPACLVVDDQVVSRSLTNCFGEFQLRYDRSTRPELRVGVPQHGLLALPLEQTGGLG